VGSAGHVDSETDIDAAYTRFLTTFRSLIDCCIPTRKVTVGPRDPDFIHYPIVQDER